MQLPWQTWLGFLCLEWQRVYQSGILLAEVSTTTSSALAMPYSQTVG